MKQGYCCSTLLFVAYLCLFICPSYLRADIPGDTDSFLTTDSLNLGGSFETESFNEFLMRAFTNKPPIGFSNGGPTEQQVVLDLGQAEIQLSNTFRPGQGLTLSDYTFQFACDNTEIINSTDVSISVVEETIDNIQVANLTYDISLNKFPGPTECTSRAIRNGTADFTSIPWDVTVSGLVLYNTTTRQIISGGVGTPLAQTYETALDNPNGVIQGISAKAAWPDGCTTDVGSCINRHINDLNNMVIQLLPDRSIYRGATSRNLAVDNSTGCAPMSATSTNGVVSLPTNCATAFARLNNPAGLAFGVGIRDYKVGTSTIDFNLPLGDGSFANNDQDVAITSAGGGRPPAVVTDLNPRQIFRRSGGENIILDGYNMAGATGCAFSIRLASGQYLDFPSDIDPQVINNPNDTQRCIFLTEPGEGVFLPWNLSVRFELTRVGYVSLVNPIWNLSYAEAPRLDTVVPTLWTEGAQVTLTGLFQTFNPNLYTTDGIILAGEFIEDITYDSFSDTRIVIRAPPQPQPDVYKYLLQVAVGETTSPSNGIEIQYLAPPIVFGFETQGPVTETPENNTFYITDNNDNNHIFSPVLGGNLDGATYRWQLFTPTGGAFQPVFTFSYNIQAAFIAEYDSPYRLRFNVTNSQNLQDSFEASVVKLRGTNNDIIVTIQTPTQRTRAIPASPLLVSVGLSLENINYQNPTFEYTWNWRGSNYTQTSADPTVPAPVLSRRTFRIPNCNMMYGNYTLTLFATVRDGLNTDSVSTSASVVVSIAQTPLVGKINGGILREAVPIVVSKNITSAASYDPDVLPNCPSNMVGCPAGLTGLECQRAQLVYNWTSCVRSRSSDFSTTEPCPSYALEEPTAMQFTLTSQELDDLVYRIPGTPVRQQTYVRYALTLTTSRTDLTNGQPDNRRTSLTYAMNLEQDQTQRVASPGGLNFLNQYGGNINPLTVRPWEDFIVGVLPPNDIGEGVQWSYRIQLPVSDEGLLQNPNNLLEGDLYWSPTGPTNQARSLGVLRSNNTFTVLKSGTPYVLTIQDYIFPTINFNPNEIQVPFTTLRYPVLTFPDLVVTQGGINTNFGATARSSEQLAEIMFYFYLIDEGNGRNIAEICLGVCGGESQVGFLLLLPGTYRIRAQMYDLYNEVLFGDQINSQTITLTNTNTAAQNQALWLDRYSFCSAAKDIGCTRYLDAIYDNVFSAVRRTIDTSSVFTNREAIAVRQSFNLVQNVLLSLNDQLTNSENTLNSAAFAANLRSLVVITSEANNAAFTEAEVIQTLSVFVQNSRNQLVNVDNGRVNQNVRSSLNSLTTVLGRLLAISLRLGSGGSTRRRLLQTTTNNMYLDTQAVIRDYMTGLSAQSLACGAPYQIYEIQNDAGEPLDDPAFVAAGKICNQIQKTSVLPVTTGEAEVTSICNQNFLDSSNSFEPRIFYVVQSANYPTANGFDNAINTLSLANIGFYEFGGYGFSASSALPFSGDRCYDMLLEYSNTLQLVPGAPASASRLTNQKEFQGPSCNINEPCYIPTSTGITATLQPSQVAVQVRADDIGLYGGVLSVVTTPSPGPTTTPEPGASSTPEPPADRGGGLSGGAIAGIVIGAILGLIVAAILIWLIATRCCGGIVPPPGDDEPFEYVERDIYGRGFVIEQSVFSESQSMRSSRLSSRLGSRLGGLVGGRKTDVPAPQTTF